MNQSAGRVGSSADNAVAEAFFSTLKRELVPPPQLPRPRRSAPVDLRMADRLQHPPAPHQLGQPDPDDYEHHYRHTAGTKPALTT